MDHAIIHRGEMVSAPLNRRTVIRNRILLALAILAALASASLLASPDAKASNMTYLYALADAGYRGSDAAWLDTGYDICQLQAAGVDTSLIASKIVVTTGSGIYTADAYEIIGIANMHLCFAGNVGNVLA
jgi:hypothetical protein